MRRLRVALETQFAGVKPTGLGVYARSLAAALRARDDVEVLDLADPRFDVWRFDRRVYWDQIRAPRLAARARAEVIHFTGGTLPLRVPHPSVLTLHDLVWLRGTNRGRFYVRWYFGALQPRLARHADVIVVDSECARRDVADGLRLDPARVRVGGAGVDEVFFSLARRPSQTPFALCVGTVEQRKDAETAVRAVAKIPGLRLVVAGPPTPYAQRVADVAREEGIADRVELCGYVDDAQLQSLYASASALIFPSRYEGFGLPPLQALAAGLPVVASRIPVLEETLGDRACYAPPGEPEAFAAALESVLVGGPAIEDQVARGRERARTFTWAAVAERVTQIYGELAG